MNSVSDDDYFFGAPIDYRKKTKISHSPPFSFHPTPYAQLPFKRIKTMFSAS